MISRSRSFMMLFLSFCVALAGCSKFEKHNQVTDAALGQSLATQIQQTPQLSKFNEYLVKTGYDKVLASSKQYTVWAPDNQTLQGLDAAIVNDTAKLKQYVGNHIVNLAYYTDMPSPVIRIQTLNGKYIKFTATTFEGADITRANTYVNNGVLHIINKIVIPQPNIWDYVLGTTFKQKTYMVNLNYTAIDSARAEQTGVDPATGKPIFKPGTGIIQKNYLFDRVGNLTNEAQEYTFLLLTDAAIDAEKAKFLPYTQGGTTANTERLNNLYVIKDYAFKGLYTLQNLPDTLTSTDGVKVPINKNAITETHTTSNGVVYVMNKVDVKPKDKILTIKQEGELPSGFSRSDKSGNISYRVRKNPITGSIFNDIYIFNHKVPLFNVNYKLHDVYSARYKIYWVAPNDVQTLTFYQRLAINDAASTFFAETLVPLKNYNEVLVGEYVVTACGDATVYIIAANNGVDQTNSINIDYFKLVPQLP